MKRILITGASGFLGKKVVPKLIKDYKVVCFIRKDTDYSFLKQFNVEFKMGDMLDKSSVISALNNIDIVLHLATSHQGGNENLNLIGSKNIIESCKEKKIKRFVYISSMAAKRRILDDYGKIKLEVEKIVRSSGLDYTILRPSVIYSNDNLSIIQRGITILPLVIPIIGNGNARLNPVHIDDVVNSIVKSIDNKFTKREYDLAGPEKLSINQIIKICRNQFKLKKAIIHFPIWMCIIIFKILPIFELKTIKGMNEDTNADISGMINDLKINPRSFSEGIKNVHL